MLAARVRKELAPGARIRVLVVDPSVVVRRQLTRALEQDPWIEVVGAAANGPLALERIPQLNPDVVTLDIEELDSDGLTAGMETLRRLRSLNPELRVIVYSAGIGRGTEATFDALAQGVDDYLTKQPQDGPAEESIVRLHTALVPKVRQFFRPGTASPSSAAASAPPGPAASIGRIQLVVLGVSTGGPAALARILPEFPPTFPVPVLIVQHMPADFTRLLAERLTALGPLKVEEAVDGASVTPGQILLAPGDYHMRVRRSQNRVTVHLNQGPPENSCRPSVDVLFRSAAEAYPGAVLAAVLTGMGHDGLRGVAALKAVGATILAQDEATSVVWGMPGAVASAGLADAILPLDMIVPEIVRRIRKD